MNTEENRGGRVPEAGGVPEGGNPPRLDLSTIRHDLKTPINHILGYCEMLQEEEELPPGFAADLARIHGGGRQLLALIAEYFDEETFEGRRGDVQRICHDLRTPVNQIIGYSEILLESALEHGRTSYQPDLNRIKEAASAWLSLMEKHLLPAGPVTSTIRGEELPQPLASLPTRAVNHAPAPQSRLERSTGGRLLVVDDDEANRDMLTRRLQRFGYVVQTASNGLEALRLLREESFDLVLMDLIMAGVDGYEALVTLKSDPALRHLPVVMLSALDQESGIARCIEAGAEDYIAKPFNPVFLRARIESSLERKRLRDQERRTYEALVVSEKHLAAELAEAADYVSSLLPAPIAEPLSVDWRFQPSAELGGDCFGYHFLSERAIAIYLLDVSGHGVGAALLSVSVLNVIRAGSLANTDFSQPASVLRGLNAMFPMERHHNLVFTLWYGVYDLPSRALVFSSGGHPPAVLLEPQTGGEMLARSLSTGGRLLGVDPESDFRQGAHRVKPGSRLYVFSDGAYEICGPDGLSRQWEDFRKLLCHVHEGDSNTLDRLLGWAREMRRGEKFEDDLSIMEIRF
jgi:sigma-B regulation protein RsbU (phosphoserine phosphatase)